MTFSGAQRIKAANRLTASRIAIGIQFSVCDMTHRAPIAETHPKDAEIVPGISLKAAVLGYEKRLITDALNDANGRITHAARYLKMDYQSLAYIIESRHAELLKVRSPVHRRRSRAQIDAAASL